MLRGLTEDGRTLKTRVTKVPGACCPASLNVDLLGPMRDPASKNKLESNRSDPREASELHIMWDPGTKHTWKNRGVGGKIG